MEHSRTPQIFTSASSRISSFSSSFAITFVLILATLIAVFYSYCDQLKSSTIYYKRLSTLSLLSIHITLFQIYHSIFHFAILYCFLQSLYQRLTMEYTKCALVYQSHEATKDWKMSILHTFQSLHPFMHPFITRIQSSPSASA